MDSKHVGIDFAFGAKIGERRTGMGVVQKLGIALGRQVIKDAPTNKELVEETVHHLRFIPDALVMADHLGQATRPELIGTHIPDVIAEIPFNDVKVIFEPEVLRSLSANDLSQAEQFLKAGKFAVVAAPHEKTEVAAWFATHGRDVTVITPREAPVYYAQSVGEQAPHIAAGLVSGAPGFVASMAGGRLGSGFGGSIGTAIGGPPGTYVGLLVGGYLGGVLARKLYADALQKQRVTDREESKGTTIPITDA